MNKHHQLLIAVMGLVCAAIPASAAMWTQPDGGVAGIFEYYNGGDLNGLYGDPIITYDPFARELTLSFLPNDFVASSTDGAGDPVETTDTLYFDLKINPAYAPLYFDVSEGGSWAISGDGTVLNESELTITELSGSDTANPTLGASSDFPLAFQLDNPFAGYWTSQADVDALNEFGADFIYFRVSLSNLLQATSEVGSTASISKLGSEVEFTIRFIPVPGALMLGCVGLICVLRRR